MGKRRPLCRTWGQQLICWAGRVSGERATYCRCAAGLALGQPGLTRWLCPWRPGGHYSTKADCGERERGRRGERVAHNRRAHGFHGNNFWKRTQSTWIVRLRPQLIRLTIIHKQNKNVNRAAGRELGFFCFRYRAQLKNYKKPSSSLSHPHTFFWKTNFFESGKWVSESVGTFPCNHNGTCYVNQ